jgi:hypothetical protein
MVEVFRKRIDTKPQEKQETPQYSAITGKQLNDVAAMARARPQGYKSMGKF